MTISGHMLRMAAADRGAALPKIGDPYGGGFYFGDITIGGEEYMLIIADIAARASLNWKNSNTTTLNTDSPIDGLANSNSMNNSSHPAAKHCRDYMGGGFDDWYLWARQECEQAELNISPNGANTPDIFKTGQPQALNPSKWHWTSTQDTATLAWIQRFSDGITASNSKTQFYEVRPIRRVRKP